MQQAQVCEAGAGLYARLRELAVRKPAAAMECAGLLGGARREAVEREAWVALARTDPETAARYAGRVAGTRYAAAPGYLSVAAVCRFVKDAELARGLRARAAAADPAIALREAGGDRAAIEAAALAAPDEAVGLASGGSAAGAAIREVLRGSGDARLRWMGAVAGDGSIPLYARGRVALFADEVEAGRMTSGAAARVCEGPGFFAALGRLRLEAGEGSARVGAYERALETYAEEMFRAEAFGGASAATVYLALTFGRSEEDDLLWGKVFDRYLLPKMAGALPADVHLTRFLAAAAAHHRLDAFLRRAGDARTVVARGVAQIGMSDEPVEAALEMADTIGALRGAALVEAARGAVRAGVERGGDAGPLYALLAAQMGEGEYRRFFRQPRVLETGGLFDAEGRLTELQFFYDDDDGAESFESFRKGFQGDAGWSWEDHGWYVRVVSAAVRGRRVVIYSNVPRTVRASAPADPRGELVKIAGGEAAFVVHRGHTWYVYESLRYVTPAARLVYLGSCRGMLSTYSVLGAATKAQLVATRGVGTHLVNDPLLKAMDEALLREDRLDWDRFWGQMRGRFGGNGNFRDYIAPPDNWAAVWMGAYFAWLEEG